MCRVRLSLPLSLLPSWDRCDLRELVLLVLRDEEFKVLLFDLLRDRDDDDLCLDDLLDLLSAGMRTLE